MPDPKHLAAWYAREAEMCMRAAQYRLNGKGGVDEEHCRQLAKYFARCARRFERKAREAMGEIDDG
ncbi:MAG TPA: hypothetical protein VMU87_01415 [Stellaceae bacterium]|nr:hypothetical protein [Stellaceae bacterium]